MVDALPQRFASRIMAWTQSRYVTMVTVSARITTRALVNNHNLSKKPIILNSNCLYAALKHYTSKLTTYDDLENVSTFGFRGEALSSLCALSVLSIITATKDDAPKGSKLEFEISGKLKNVSVVAAQKGTTVISENLFNSLPVRRKELERNVKREYTKVLGFLQAYASISTGVKFTVFNHPPKGYLYLFNYLKLL